MRLIWRSDVHLADRGPKSRTDDWLDTVCDKLRQVGNIAAEEEALAVIDGGDFFHRKSPMLTSHRLIRRVAEVHRDYPCPVYATVGNHDCVWGDIEFLPQQPLGVLFATGVFRPLYGENEAMFDDGRVSVRVVGVPYHGTKYNLDLLRPEKGGEDYLMVAAHVLARAARGKMFEGEDIVGYEDLQGTDVDLYSFGHWHQNQGVEEREGTWFVNVGSLTRGSLCEDDLDRVPCCAVLDFDEGGLSVREVPLDVKPASQVFDLAEAARNELHDTAIEEYVAGVRSALVESREETLEDIIRSMENVPPTVRERAILILEEAGV
jgi:DNA repair exonuclease SbcCD nuclease subunit